MKSIKPKKCKVCQDEYKPRATTQQACSPICAIEYAKVKAKKKIDKEQNKAHRLRKLIFKANDLTKRSSAAKKACHAYIRERDKDLLCICCNKPLGKTYHAGHFLESGNFSSIRFDEDNIHAQRVYCNTYKGGNSDDYRGNLIKKIGADRVKRLDSIKNNVTKRTCEDYKEIEEHYKAKLKLIRGSQ